MRFKLNQDAIPHVLGYGCLSILMTSLMPDWAGEAAVVKLPLTIRLYVFPEVVKHGYIMTNKSVTPHHPTVCFP